MWMVKIAHNFWSIQISQICFSRYQSGYHRCCYVHCSSSFVNCNRYILSTVRRWNGLKATRLKSSCCRRHKMEHELHVYWWKIGHEEVKTRMRMDTGSRFSMKSTVSASRKSFTSEFPSEVTWLIFMIRCNAFMLSRLDCHILLVGFKEN